VTSVKTPSGTGVTSLHGYTSAHGSGVTSAKEPVGTGISSIKGFSNAPHGSGITTGKGPVGTGLTSHKDTVTLSSTAKGPSGTGVTSVKGTGVTSIHPYAPESTSSATLKTGIASSSLSSATHHSSGTAVSSALGVKVTSSSTSTHLPSTTLKSTPSGTGAVGTHAPAPTQTGTIASCNSWTLIEDDSCSCLNIQTQYGISQAQFISWNPAVGAGCKLVVGDAYCVGIKETYGRRAVNGRLARFAQ